jgi:hypothetical protein
MYVARLVNREAPLRRLLLLCVHFASLQECGVHAVCAHRAHARAADDSAANAATEATSAAIHVIAAAVSVRGMARSGDQRWAMRKPYTAVSYTLYKTPLFLLLQQLGTAGTAGVCCSVGAYSSHVPHVTLKS